MCCGCQKGGAAMYDYMRALQIEREEEEHICHPAEQED